MELFKASRSITEEISLILNDSLFTISFSENLLGISEKSLNFPVIIVTETTENFNDFSLN